MKYIVLPASRVEQKLKCSWCEEDKEADFTIACYHRNALGQHAWREYACTKHQEEHFPVADQFKDEDEW